MRRKRRLLLLAIVLISGGVGSVYLKQRASLRLLPAPKMEPIREGLQASSEDWVYRKDDGNCPVVEVRAKEVESAEGGSPQTHLTGVQLLIFHNCGAAYDHVKSAEADFNPSDGILFSEGEVEITLAVPADPDASPGRLLTIKSSEVVFETSTGKARTEKLTSFAFDLGDGYADGATYIPQTRELELHSNVVLRWRGNHPEQKLMTIEAGHLVYNESDARVHLTPWAKFTRENLTLEGGETFITLEKGSIRLVESVEAHGTDQQPGRDLTFAADSMRMDMTEKSQVQKITGLGAARLNALSASAATKITTDQIELDFDPSSGESILRTALATGNSVLESKPVTRAGQTPGHTRVLKSEVVLTKMRAGGEEIEAMETHTPGTLDLLPNAAHQPRRHLTAERMWVAYAAQNRLKSCRAVGVSTQTFKPNRKTPSLTWSQDLLAEFDPESNEMSRLEQWDNFRYEEGDRRATSSHATLEAKTNFITLDRPARTWDSSGSVSADRIVMNQETGDFTAEGKVASSRLPDSKTTSSGAMLDGREPMQATAARMVATDQNRKVLYEGGAVLWQGGNRLEADRVLINREMHSLLAEGHVISRLLDKEANAKTGRQTLTVVRAAALNYNDRDRLALYQGGVKLHRDAMDVDSTELRAWLAESKPAGDGTSGGGGGSSLERAFADGDVRIVETMGTRVRNGTAQHAEYYVNDEKVVLNGGIAQMVDSVKGTTRGRQLTYYSRNDSLQVEGALTQPASSTIRRN
ncbi:MAG: LptA/OstA family protein [Bryobacteraceae bacterium]